MDIFNSCGNLKVEMFILLSSRCPLKLASRSLSRLTVYKRNIRLMTFLFWNLLSQPRAMDYFKARLHSPLTPHSPQTNLINKSQFTIRYCCNWYWLGLLSIIQLQASMNWNSSNNKSILLYICLDIWFKQTDTKPILHPRFGANQCRPVDKQARSKDWFNFYPCSDAISANELINECVYMIWHW